MLHAKHAMRIEGLKRSWKENPCWDIECTEGFEALFDELKKFSDKYLADEEAEKARTGSRSTGRTLKRLSGRERRFMKNDNHVMSCRIVDFSRDTGHPTIAMEELGGIRNGRKLRKEQRTDLNRWAFYELEQFIRYKAGTLTSVPV